MASHYHMSMGGRLRNSGSPDTRLPDFHALKAAGVNIISPTDWMRTPERLEVLADYFEGARRHSDRDFLIMPNEEQIELLGGHWTSFSRTRSSGPQTVPRVQPFVEEHPTYGTLYHVGSAEDVMEMARRENALIFMPHPRTKGSTYYPGRGQGHAALPGRELSRDRMAMGYGPGPCRSAACRTIASCPCSTT